MKGTCEHCKWWAANGTKPNPTTGECHRHAPRLIVAGCGTGDSPEYNHDWAETDKSDFCGDYKSKENEEYPWHYFCWTIRVRKALAKHGIDNVEKLIEHSEMDLLGIRCFGMTSLREVKLKLFNVGLSLKNSKPKTERNDNYYVKRGNHE